MAKQSKSRNGNALKKALERQIEMRTDLESEGPGVQWPQHFRQQCPETSPRRLGGLGELKGLGEGTKGVAG